MLFLTAAVLYGEIPSDWLGWVLAVLWFSLLILFSRRLATPSKRKSAILWTIVVWLVFAAIAGGSGALAYAITTNFSEEEFFVAVSGVALGLFWFVLAVAYHLAFSASVPLLSTKKRMAFLAALLIFSAGLTPWVLNRYQRSFFPATAPTYPGISENTPFLCDTLDVPPQTIPAEQIRNDYLALLTAAPQKNTLIWGNLAHYTGDAAYAAEFRRSLLQEAADGRYTTPANSVKWGQYEAALRAHQLALISRDFPALFSAEDWQTLKTWFAAVNRRAMTVEWVDWLYASAYGKRPQGPYENQEIGVGLLAVLMTHNWAATDLAEQNRAYLDTVPLGWQKIFRNTDDSYSYQGVWVPNAWWLHNYRQSTGDTIRRNTELSFQWLLLQALPDGATLTYNISSEPTSLTAYLFGASLLHNSQLSWLAGKNAQWLAERNLHLWGEFTIPNLDFPAGQTPDVGSCLMYGNSGVPTKKGVLGPDKIVLRDGWTDDATVVLSDLRFTGWHRYKATNTTPLIYSHGPVASERETTESFWWLPTGRSAFRDKRIPREYLNGLLLPKSGLSAVLWRLTGIGSEWAQNSPAYAAVDTFFTGDGVDMAQTTLSNWNGWHHTRTDYLVHNGITLVVDSAAATSGTDTASVIWHLNGDGIREKNGLNLANSLRPAKMAWLPEDGAHVSLSALPTGDSFLRSPNWELLYTAPDARRLNFAAAFLTENRTKGDISLQRVGDSDGVVLQYTDDTLKITLLHNNHRGYRQTDTIGTDGTAGWFIEQGDSRRVCVVNGQRISVKMDEPIHGVSAENDVEWNFEDGRLDVELAQPGSVCVEIR